MSKGFMTPLYDHKVCDSNSDKFPILAYADQAYRFVTPKLIQEQLLIRYKDV